MPTFHLPRRIHLNAPPETVWPWIAQMGRGAGWYSFDWVDNGGRRSAQHILSWVPEPQLGDACPIGFLDQLEPGRELSWFLPRTRRLGITLEHRMTCRVTPAGTAPNDSRGTDLLIEMCARFGGPLGWLLAPIYRIGDAIMAHRQLHNLRRRVERFGSRTEDPSNPETGARDQYQRHHGILADGTEVGRPGWLRTDRHRAAAIARGLLGHGSGT